MVRILVVLLLTALGCEGKPAPATGSSGSAGPATPVRADAALDASTDAGPLLKRVSATGAREAALPERTPCAATCADMKMSPAVDACYRAAQTLATRDADARILLIGQRTKGPVCMARKVVIDCCPAYKPTDLKGIAKRLGWATANVEERKAIAWVIARVVVGGSIIDEDNEDSVAQGLSMPGAREDHGGIILDYWVLPDGARSADFIHEQLTFRATGEVSEMVERQDVVSP